MVQKILIGLLITCHLLLFPLQGLARVAEAWQEENCGAGMGSLHSIVVSHNAIENNFLYSFDGIPDEEEAEKQIEAMLNLTEPALRWGQEGIPALQQFKQGLLRHLDQAEAFLKNYPTLARLTTSPLHLALNPVSAISQPTHTLPLARGAVDLLFPETRLDVALNVAGPAAKAGSLALSLGKSTLFIGKEALPLLMAAAKPATKALGKLDARVNARAFEIHQSLFLEGEKRLLTPFTRDARAYIMDMQSRSNLLIPSNQREFLAQVLRDRGFVKLGAEESRKHTTIFKNPKLKDRLITEWKTYTGQQWPRFSVIDKVTGEPMINPITGLPKMEKAQAHHIIPQEIGGPHEWWNMHPLERGSQHQGGVHGQGSILRKMLKDTKDE